MSGPHRPGEWPPDHLSGPCVVLWCFGEGCVHTACPPARYTYLTLQPTLPLTHRQATPFTCATSSLAFSPGYLVHTCHTIWPSAGDTIHLRHIIPCLLDGGLIGTFQMDSSFMRGASPSYASPEEVAEMEERAWKQEQVVGCVCVWRGEGGARDGVDDLETGSGG